MTKQKVYIKGVIVERKEERINGHYITVRDPNGMIFWGVQSDEIPDAVVSNEVEFYATITPSKVTTNRYIFNSPEKAKIL